MGLEGMAVVLGGMAVILEVAILEVVISGVVVSNDWMERRLILCPFPLGCCIATDPMYSCINILNKYQYTRAP
jgi:hypothetical protein